VTIGAKSFRRTAELTAPIRGVIKYFLRYHSTGMDEQHTVLVVEDDHAARRMYRTALAFAGFDVIEADDAISALRLLDQRSVDVVVLDLMLPTMSGLAVQQEIAAHAHTRSIPIVIVTGSDISLDHVDVPCILRKPFLPERLVEAVRTCLASGARGVTS
jgi:DNA-binding response OmpR family regulator